jgi:hypothetical protein
MSRTQRTPRLLAGITALLALMVFFGPLREHAFAIAARLPSPQDSGPVEARFTRSSANGPLVWSTCTPIHVLVNPGPFGAPATAEIHAAFAEMSRITGLRFVFAATQHVPRTNWAHTPGEWEVPPVLVAWVEPHETDLLGASASGATVANPAGRGSDRHIVTGAIALDASEYMEFADGNGPGRTRRNLLLHEIGHLLGLDHAEGGGLMHTAITGSTPDGLHPAEAHALRSAYIRSAAGC